MSTSPTAAAGDQPPADAPAVAEPVAEPVTEPVAAEQPQNNEVPRARGSAAPAPPAETEQQQSGTPKAATPAAKSPSNVGTPLPPNMALNLTPRQEEFTNAKAFLLKSSTKSNLNL